MAMHNDYNAVNNQPTSMAGAFAWQGHFGTCLRHLCLHDCGLESCKVLLLARTLPQYRWCGSALGFMFTIKAAIFATFQSFGEPKTWRYFNYSLVFSVKRHWPSFTQILPGLWSQDLFIYKPSELPGCRVKVKLNLNFHFHDEVCFSACLDYCIDYRYSPRP